MHLFLITDISHVCACARYTECLTRRQFLSATVTLSKARTPDIIWQTWVTLQYHVIHIFAETLTFVSNLHFSKRAEFSSYPASACFKHSMVLLTFAQLQTRRKAIVFIRERIWTSGCHFVLSMVTSASLSAINSILVELLPLDLLFKTYFKNLTNLCVYIYIHHIYRRYIYIYIHWFYKVNILWF